MSRSGYSDDYDQGQLAMWRGAVRSAIKGHRGQAFLKEMLAALDALPEKKLIADELEQEHQVCAIGAVGLARKVDMTNIDPHDPDTVSGKFGIARALACEIVFENDEGAGYWKKETPEDRFTRMRRWVEGNIDT